MGRAINAQGEGLYTRREWLTRHAIVSNTGPFRGRRGLGRRRRAAQEAVATTATEHPEWDLDDERKTMAQWDMMENL